MTARDEALRAMSGAWSTTASKSYGLMLDAIPSDVLVQLAIERGALEVAYGASGAKYINTAGETLYRVVEP
jgi:hypothetical protein